MENKTNMFPLKKKLWQMTKSEQLIILLVVDYRKKFIKCNDCFLFSIYTHKIIDLYETK